MNRYLNYKVFEEPNESIYKDIRVVITDIFFGKTTVDLVPQYKINEFLIEKGCIDPFVYVKK